MKFADIKGQTYIKEHLQTAIAKNRTSHSYIISGEKGSGKHMMAEAFAQTLFCEKGGNDACGECPSCKKVMSHNHPDFHFVTPEDGKVLSVGDVRTQINDDVVIRPYQSKYKIYIVEGTDGMRDVAQNALLKTIEEPPEYVIILLLATNALSFLQTILSRCITLELSPIPKEIIKKELMEHYMAPDYQAEMCATFAQGNMGRAIYLASSEEFNETKNYTISLLRRLERMDSLEIHAAADDMGSRAEYLQDYLDLMNIYFRDVLLYKSTGDVMGIVFVEEVGLIKMMAKNMRYDGIEIILKTIATTKKKTYRAKAGDKVKAPIHVALELLLLTVKENLHG